MEFLTLHLRFHPHPKCTAFNWSDVWLSSLSFILTYLYFYFEHFPHSYYLLKLSGRCGGILWTKSGSRVKTQFILHYNVNLRINKGLRKLICFIDFLLDLCEQYGGLTMQDIHCIHFHGHSRAPSLWTWLYPLSFLIAVFLQSVWEVRPTFFFFFKGQSKRLI